MSGVGGCCVPKTQGNLFGKGLGGSTEFCSSSQSDGSLPQSAALPGAARGRGVSSSAAPHLHFPNSGPVHHCIHLTTGKGCEVKCVTVLQSGQCNQAANPSFQTDILRIGVPKDGRLSPACAKRPWNLAVCAGLLCCAGWYLWLVCWGRAFAVYLHGKHENRLCDQISCMPSGTLDWTCPNGRFHQCAGPDIVHVHFHGNKASSSVQPCKGHHFRLPDLLCDLGDLHSNLHWPESGQI